MILGESSKSSHTPVEILLLHKIFRYPRRIPQAEKSPQLGETMLQGLNPMLQEKRHELCTRQRTSSTTFQLLDAGQGGLISSISASVGGEFHEANFFNSWEASNGAMSYLSEEELFRSLM
jgi:hypothetical protein